MDSLSKITVPADVVTHNTSSYFEFFKPQILDILAAGYHIVSSAEELSFPGWRMRRMPGRSTPRPNAPARPCWPPGSTPAF